MANLSPIAAVTNIPWGLHPIDPSIFDSLSARSSEVNMNSPVNPNDPSYAGPRTAWVRFFSNGKSSDSDDGGFLMFGANGFDDSYGFNTDHMQTLGLDCNGKPITMLADGSTGMSFPHRPPPAIDSVEVKLYGGQNASFSGLCRKARVNWKCYSLEQLNKLTPYFLRPKVSALVEWGWNNYDPASLIDLKNKDELFEIFITGTKIMDKIKISKGNYDAMMGFIFDYGFTLNSDGGYDCFTEFVNANWLIEGQEYKSESNYYTPKSGENSGSATPVKTFTEFVNTDMDDLVIKTTLDKESDKYIFYKDRAFVTDPNLSRNPSSIGASTKKQWFRMDLVAEILNAYFSITYKSINGKVVGKSGVLDISDTVICAHPMIKSTDIEILIPNQYAPRFTTLTSEQNAGNTDSSDKSKSILTQQVESQDYSKLFKDTGVFIILRNQGTGNQLTTEFDDLFSVINKGSNGNSFPVFKTGADANNKGSPPGSWGYLKDIFVSVDLIKDVVEKNDTAFRVIQDLMDHISQALCGVVQLKVIPHQLATALSVIDTNYNPNSTTSAAETLYKIIPGSVNSAYILNAGFSVKLSQDMANQMVAESANATAGGNMKSIGVKKYHRFIGSDRLYDYGTITSSLPPSVDSTKTQAEVSDRDFSNKFPFYQDGTKKNKKYLLIEPNVDFMKMVLSSDTTGKMIYMNSPLMPGTKFEMETLGVGGITFLSQFTLDHVPETYSYKNAVWQIADIEQKIAQGGMWTTRIVADCRPLSFISKQ
jgi:hypothetical protein